MNLLKIMFLLLSFLLFGCRKTIEEDIVLMQSSPFKLNIDSLFCVKLAHDTFVEPEVSGKIKIVIFSDSKDPSRNGRLWKSSVQRFGIGAEETELSRPQMNW